MKKITVLFFLASILCSCTVDQQCVDQAFEDYELTHNCALLRKDMKKCYLNGHSKNTLDNQIDLNLNLLGMKESECNISAIRE